MREYGDMLMYGLKNIMQNVPRALRFYQMAAEIGYCEAKMAMALNLEVRESDLDERMINQQKMAFS